MNEEDVKAVVESIGKTLPEVIGKAVNTKFEELSVKTVKELESVKAELKSMTINSKSTPESKSLQTKAIIVGTFKGIYNEKVDRARDFKAIFEASVKTMTEGTATAGAELVFDQFEKDVLQVINEYPVVQYVKQYNIIKWDTLKIPKVTNGQTTAYVAEAWTPTPADDVTAFVTFNIYKAVTLVNVSEELMDDTMTIPDLYDLLVRNIAESQAEFLENEILNGTGSSALEGLFVNSDVAEIVLWATETAWDITFDDIVSVVTKVPMKYKRNSKDVKWTMSQYVYGKLIQIQTTSGVPIFPELTANMTKPFLMGYAVVISDKAPVQNAAADIADADALIFWDLKYYAIVKRGWLNTKQGYYGSNWINGIVSLKWDARYGWKPTFGGAFTKLTNGASS